MTERSRADTTANNHASRVGQAGVDGSCRNAGCAHTESSIWTAARSSS